MQHVIYIRHNLPYINGKIHFTSTFWFYLNVGVICQAQQYPQP
jgi:hypothetical protein